MEWLLPKKDQERLSLHRYLNAQESNVVLIKGIMDSLGWSRYLVLQNVTMVRIDYQQIGDCNTSYFALMLDLRTDFSLPCKLITEEHFLYDSIFTRI